MSFLLPCRCVAALVLSLLICAGCSRLPASFDVTTRGQTTIERGTVVEQLVGTLGFGQFTNLDLSQSQEFKNREVQRRHVARANVEALELRIVSPTPEGQDFDFLETISFYVEAPGLERKRIAHKQVPRDSRSFKCEMDDLELAPYVRAERMTVTTSVRGRRPENDTAIEARLVIAVSTVLWRGD